MSRAKGFAKGTLRTLLALFLVVSFVPFSFSSAYAQEQETTYEIIDGNYVDDEILIVFKEDTSETKALRALESIDAEVSSDDNLEEALEDSSPVVVELEEGVSVSQAVAEANDNPNVEIAQPNYIYTLPANEEVISVDSETAQELQAALTASVEAESDGATTKYVPNDPAVSTTTYSKYSANAWQLADIKAFDAWDMAKTNNTVTVAVLDTGCLLDHEDLVDRVWADYAWNAYSNSALTKDYQGHGTHVCGCVAATADNSTGTAGASFNAKVLPICVFDSNGEYCYTDTLIDAYDYLLKYADALNIHVVNMSLGGYGSKDQSDILLEGRIATARTKNIMTVAAGGNGDDYGNPLTTASYPSDLDGVFAVTALSTDGKTPTTWCDYNSSKDICAPGLYIYSTSKSSKTSYEIMSGTSMASPIVAGCAALIFAANSSLTVDQVEKAIKDTAGDITVESGREGLYGAGKINLAAAVESVMSTVKITTKTLEVDTSAQLQLACENKTSGTITWSVTNGTGSASINASTGLLTAKMPGTVYVTAQSSSSASEKATATVTVKALSLAEAPSVKAKVNGLQVSWTACANAKGYTVERATSKSGTYTTLTSLENGSTTYLDTTVSRGITYYYRVTPYSSVAKSGTGTASESVGGYLMPSLTKITADATSSLNEKSLEAAVSYLSSQGGSIETAVLVASADSNSIANAASVAGVVGGLVIESGSSYSSSLSSTLSNLGVKNLIVMASTSEISNSALNYYSWYKFSTTRYTGSTLQASAATVVNAYKGSWSDTVLICSPSNKALVNECASYLYAAKIPVLFTQSGGTSIDSTTLSSAANFSKAIVLGDTSAVSQAAVTSLQNKGLSCTRIGTSDLSITLAKRGVSEGVCDYSSTSVIEEDAGFESLTLGSLVGYMGSPLLCADSDDALTTLEFINQQKSAIASSYVCGTTAYCTKVAPLIESATDEECSGFIAVSPVDSVVSVGETVTLNVKVIGQVSSYQWQYSQNGTTWSNTTESGCKTNTLTFKMSTQKENYAWRCVVTYTNSSTETSGAAVSCIRGDINANSSINIVDAQIAYDLASGTYGTSYGSYDLPTYWTTSTLQAIADFNENAGIDTQDASAIQTQTHTNINSAEVTSASKTNSTKVSYQTSVSEVVAKTQTPVYIVLEGKANTAAPAAAEIYLSFEGSSQTTITTSATDVTSMPNVRTSIDTSTGKAMLSYYGNSGSSAMKFNSSGKLIIAKLVLTANETGTLKVTTDNKTSKCAVSGATDEYAFTAGTNLALTIENPTPSAPTGLTGVNETVSKKADGKITGVTSAMEYRAAGTSTYTAVPAQATEITGLAAGTYYVRYAATSKSKVSPDTEVTIAAGDKLTVTFNAGSYATAPDSQSLDWGDKAAAPTNPTRSGYAFVGWYTSASYATAYNFNSAVTQNITLYAKWAKQTILAVRGVAYTSSHKLTWTSVAGATKYVLYGKRASASSYSKYATTTATSKTITVSKKNYYKYYVVAYKGSTKLATSYAIMLAPASYKANVTAVKASATAKTLAVGKSVTITAKASAKYPTTKTLYSSKVYFRSSDSSIATVTSAGKITAQSTGTCYVYVYALSGAYTRVKVTVL